MSSTKFKIIGHTLKLSTKLMRALADEYGAYREELTFVGTELGAKRKATAIYDAFGSGGGRKVIVKAVNGRHKLKWIKSKKTSHEWTLYNPS